MSSLLPASADAVIVGGGIMGASIAWQLASRNAGRVVLLERSVICAGASGRTGALLRQHYTNLPEATLASRSLEIFRNWAGEVGGDCGFQPSGLIVTIPTRSPFEANIERMRRTVAQLRSIGVAIDLLDAATLHDLDPAAQFDDLTVATFEPESGYVDAVAATTSMAAAAQRHGARVIEGVTVTRLVESRGKITGIRTTHGDIAAPVVVITNGPWSVSLARTVDVELPITSLRVQVAIFQTPMTEPAPIRAYVDNVAGIFCRPWGQGRTMVGLGGGDQHDPVEPEEYDPNNDHSFPAAAQAAMSRRFQSFRNSLHLHGHAGLYDMTPDGHPIIGPGGPDGLWLVAGFSGAGYKKGPAVGMAVADHLLSGRSDWIDLSRFGVSRFSSDAWKKPWSPDEYTLASDFGHGF